MIPKHIKLDDYVYATRWKDGDRHDPHFVGFVQEIRECASGEKYVYVGTKDESQGRWFENCQRLKNPDYGAAILSGDRPEFMACGKVNSIMKKILE